MRIRTECSADSLVNSLDFSVLLDSKVDLRI